MKVQQVYTLAFLKRDDDVLLGLKTRGLGRGLWNGFGGKLKPGETILEAAKREIKEECDVEVRDLKHIGFMQYEHDGQPEISIVHMFTGTQIRGNPEPSEEMNPVQWYHRKDLRNLKMYEDFKHWEEHIFQDHFFYGKVHYDTQKRIVEKFIRRCDSLDDVLLVLPVL